MYPQFGQTAQCTLPKLSLKIPGFGQEEGSVGMQMTQGAGAGREQQVDLTKGTLRQSCDLEGLCAQDH